MVFSLLACKIRYKFGAWQHCSLSSVNLIYVARLIFRLLFTKFIVGIRLVGADAPDRYEGDRGEGEDGGD